MPTGRAPAEPTQVTTQGGTSMSNRAGHYGAALSFLVVSALVLGALFAFIAIGPAAQAASCDQVSRDITGTWTITTVQECSGIVYSVDGSIIINSGGSLKLTNGGLRFTMDTAPAHSGYALNVNAGGSLILDNSIVTTEVKAINPYVYLPLTVSGANSMFTMMNGAMLKFPGWFNATSATVNITDSTITGFDDSDLQGSGLNIDASNDGPVISWTATTAMVYRSRIDRIYEGTTARNVALSTASNLYAYDSYIGVDYANGTSTHNALTVDGSSNAYLFGVTIDRTQEDPTSRANWQPAFGRRRARRPGTGRTRTARRESLCIRTRSPRDPCRTLHRSATTRSPQRSPRRPRREGPRSPRIHQLAPRTTRGTWRCRSAFRCGRDRTSFRVPRPR